MSYEKQKKFVLMEDFEVDGKKTRGMSYTSDFYLDKLDMVIDIKGSSIIPTEVIMRGKLLRDKHGKEIIFLHKCPKKFEEQNIEPLFKGWIENKFLNKLQKVWKKENPREKKVAKVKIDKMIQFLEQNRDFNFKVLKSGDKVFSIKHGIGTVIKFGRDKVKDDFFVDVVYEDVGLVQKWGRELKNRYPEVFKVK